MFLFVCFFCVVGAFAERQHCNVTGMTIHVSSGGQRYLKYENAVQHDGDEKPTTEFTYFCLVGAIISPQLELCYQCSPRSREEGADDYHWRFLRWLCVLLALVYVFLRAANV